MSTFKEASDAQLNTEVTSHESIKMVNMTSELLITGSDTGLGPSQLSFNLAPDYIDISYAVVGCFGFVIICSFSQFWSLKDRKMQIFPSIL